MTHSDFVRYEDLSAGELRARLLGFAGEFVRDARTLPGITRIALLGSLLTPKDDPKDIDLVVTVADACDLTPLAKLGRRLQGRAQGLNHGADVFLASPSGAYLGRTCPWRECRPGIRAACDADHCGARPFLHNDRRTITLPGSVIASPPLELYPTVVARVGIPPDVAAWLASSIGALAPNPALMLPSF